MTDEDKYSLHNSENLQEPFQMQISKMLKTFTLQFAELVECPPNCKHFVKKMIVLAYVFSKLPTVKSTLTQMFKWDRVIGRFYGQHVKRFEKLVKCPWEYLYKFSLSLWTKLTWKSSLLLVCELVQVRSQVFPFLYLESAGTIWNAII